MELPSGIVEPRTSYVGFWPWPRVWGTNEAKELATALPGSTHLETDLNAAQAGLFRSVAARYDGTGFDVQYCADGLITYRHHGHEEAISQNWEEFRLDPTAPLSASEVAWAHYVQALNILFAVFESALHTNRNIDGLFWIEPVGRTDVVRIRYDEHGAALSDAAFGPRTEMGLQRRAGHESVGARIDGIYDPRVIAAFMETKATFEARARSTGTVAVPRPVLHELDHVSPRTLRLLCSCILVSDRAVPCIAYGFSSFPPYRLEGCTEVARRR